VRKPKPSTTQDDKKLQAALKKLGAQPIAGVEEVNMFREDGNVLHFTAPKGESSPLCLDQPPPLADDRSGFVHEYSLIIAIAFPGFRTITDFLPIVQTVISGNTFVVHGQGQVKELTELVPGILNQLGPDSLASLRKLAESYQAIQTQQKPSGADDDDDDVPDLVENFEADQEGEKVVALD